MPAVDNVVMVCRVWIPALDSGTFYIWRMAATDAAGHVTVRTGMVRTLRRVVTVMFNTIDMDHDSDIKDNGEFRTWVKAGRTTARAMTPESITEGDTSRCSRSSPCPTPGGGRTC